MTIDEDRFLRWLLPTLTAGPDVPIPPGDDCAAIAWLDERWLLVAADQVAAGVHYYGREEALATPAELAGRKLLARNLSDIAAMGGRARYALLAIAASPSCPEPWLRRFVEGVRQLADAWAVSLVGGDVARGAADVASLTILGEVAPSRVLRRSAAKPGDRLLVTGCFGGSLPSGHHLTFTPRLVEGAWLAAHGATAAIDVSDGLLRDLLRLVEASGVGACLDSARIPRRRWATGAAEVTAALTDGEDYELIVAVPPAAATALIAEWPFTTALTDLGEIVALEAGAAPVRDLAGLDLGALAEDGWQHFGGTR